MTAEPVAGKEILTDNHSCSDHHGIGDTQQTIATQTVATENGTADDRLEQIVCKTHTSEDAKMMKHMTYTLEGIPARNHCRDNHQKNHEVIDRREP